MGAWTPLDASVVTPNHAHGIIAITADDMVDTGAGAVGRLPALRLRRILVGGWKYEEEGTPMGTCWQGGQLAAPFRRPEPYRYRVANHTPHQSMDTSLLS